MKVFIIPLEQLVEVTRMPYIVSHEIGRGFTPRGHQVEAVTGQIYEVPRLTDMILVFDSAEEMNRERDQLQAYEEKSAAYFEAYNKIRYELKIEPDEFMRTVPFDTFK